VVVQNKKFEDWFPTLTLLRQTFTDYSKLVVNYHQRTGIIIPAAANSTIKDARVLTCHLPPSVLHTQLPDSSFAHDEYDANVFVLPASKNRHDSTISRKSITGSSINISSPNKTGNRNGWKSDGNHNLNRSLDRDNEGRKMTKGGLDDGILKRPESQSILATARSIAIMIPFNTVKSEKNEEKIYSKSFGGEYKVQQANSNKVGLRLNLS
jgi:hypothetical protein